MIQELIKILINNVGLKSISLFIAIVLWFVVLGSRTVQDQKEISVEIETSANMVVANEIPAKVVFKLSGPKAFLRAVVEKEHDPIRIKLSGASPGPVTYRFSEENISIPLGVDVKSISPPAVLIRLEEVVSKEVHIKPIVQGTLSEYYKMGQIKVEPTHVVIRGARSRIEPIREIRTEPIEVSDLRENFERVMPLDLPSLGVELDSAFPTVTIPVEPVIANYKLKNVKLRILSTLRVRAKVKTVTVYVQATMKELENLDQTRIFAEVDLRGKGAGNYTATPTLTLPPQISVLRISPKDVRIQLY